MDRKLTTIFASDVVGFSKMMGEDEVKTLNILKERREAIDSIIEDHGGVIFGSAGDTGGRKPANVTIATCWDADRLDIGRVGATVEEKFLVSEEAKRIV